jgi:predicted ATP-grasp superfamily ATP-dependent carboligase
MKILIAGISVRAAVESAVRSGCTVIALDAFGDLDTGLLAKCRSLHHDFDLRYSPQALYHASLGLEYDAIAYTANLENYPEILESISGGRPIIGNTPSTLRSVRCWPALSARLRKAGFQVPDSVFDIRDHRSNPAGRWLVKPVLSGGGRGIKAYKGNNFPIGSFYLQRHVSGKPCSASFVANGSESVVIGISEQLVGMRRFGAGSFRYCGSVLPFSGACAPGLSEMVLDQVRRIAAFLTREYGLRGVNGIDFILRGSQVCVIEVNPRYSASMELIESAHELPVFRTHLQAALHGELPAFRIERVSDSRQFIGKAILFADRNAVAPDVKRWLDNEVKDVPRPGDRWRKGDPICTVLAKGATFEETVTTLIRRAGELKKEIYG